MPSSSSTKDPCTSSSRCSTSDVARPCAACGQRRPARRGFRDNRTVTSAEIVGGIAFAAFAALSVILAVIDVREHRLPNRLVLPAYPAAIGVLALACVLGASWASLVRALVAMAVLFAFYAVLRLASRAGFGGGDVKLSGVIGLMLGWLGWDAVVVGLVAAFVLGGLFGVVLLASRRADRTTRIAFGPWMLVGAWIGIAAVALPSLLAR